MAVQIVIDEDEDATPLSEEVVIEGEATPAPAVKVAPTPVVPDRYKGKTAEELIRMHEEAQKLLGRQGAELGELRRSHDEYTKAAVSGTRQTTPAQHTQEAQDDSEIEFFANPKAAVAKAIDQHPEVQAWRKSQVQSKVNEAKTIFVQKHSDSQEILADPEFQNWVDASKIRTALLVQADKNYDLDAAEEIFSTWKQIKGVSQSAASARETATRKEAAEATQREALRAGMVPTGAGAPPSGNGKKNYTSAQMVRLKMTDPDWYAANEQEITAAYREGRVK